MKRNVASKKIIKGKETLQGILLELTLRVNLILSIPNAMLEGVGSVDTLLSNREDGGTYNKVHRLSFSLALA